LGLCHLEFDHVAASPALLKESLAAVKVLAAAHPEDFDYLKQQAVILNSLAIIERQNLNWEEAERLWKEARAIRQTLVERFPDDPALLFGLAKCLNNLGYEYALRLRAAEGQRALFEAQRLMNSLVEKYPHKASYRDFLALVDFNLGLAASLRGRSSEAEETFQKGLALAKPLVDRYPTVPGYRATLVVLQLRQAELLWHRGKVDAAFALYTDATRTVPPEQARERVYARALESLVQAHAGRAKCLGHYGRYREAVWEWDKVLELEPYPIPLRRLERASALARLGDHAGATRATEAVVKQWQDPLTLYHAASVYALSVAAVEKASPLAERYGARAVALLRQAIAKPDYEIGHPRRMIVGHPGFGIPLDDPNFEPIRQRADFQQVRHELRYPSPAPGKQKPRFVILWQHEASP
jgi:tetratricopeptide (TPR) repeat protein